MWGHTNAWHTLIRMWLSSCDVREVQHQPGHIPVAIAMDKAGLDTV
jgi:hypothetical protein